MSLAALPSVDGSTGMFTHASTENVPETEVRLPLPAVLSGNPEAEVPLFTVIEPPPASPVRALWPVDISAPPPTRLRVSLPELPQGALSFSRHQSTGLSGIT